MGFFTGIKNFFRGAFGGNDDEEERRRREQEDARLRALQQQKPKPVQNIGQLFGQRRQPQNAQVVVNKTPVEEPKPQVVQPVVRAPRVDAALQQRVAQYEVPGVQDVNGYYNNDLKVLKEEVAKGEQADQRRIQGIMQSLDNRKKELQEFHKQRGEAKSFKSARALEEKIKNTRGDWTKENEKLQKFWDNVSKEEGDDLLAFLAEQRGGVDPRRIGMDWRRKDNFEEDEKKVADIQSRQQLADEAMKYKDNPLDQMNNRTIQEYLEEFRTASPERQRDILGELDKQIVDNEGNASASPELQRKYEQAYILKAVLEDSGEQDSNWKTKLFNFGKGAKSFGGSLVSDLKRVPQSIGALAGDEPAKDAHDDWQAGKLTDEEYNAKLAQIQRDYGWVPKDGDMKARILTSLGTAADTVATFLPLGSVTKGAKAVRKGASLGKLIKTEAAANAAYSGVGSLRGGEFDAKKALTESLFGGTVGALAPIAGRGLSKFFGRGVERGESRLPESLDNLAEGADNNVGRDIRQQLEDIVNDPNEPAFRRKDAQRVLDTQPAPANATPTPVAEGLDRPTFLHNQDIQRIIDRETANLERFVNENPQLTKAQIEKVVEETRNRVIKLTDELTAKRNATSQVVDAQGNVIEEAQTAQQAVNAEVAANQAAKTTPPPGEVVQTTPATNPEVAANDAYSRFNEEAGLTSGSEDISYMTAQQQLERVGGNKTLDDLGGRQRGRVPTAIHEKTQGVAADALSGGVGTLSGRLLTSQNRVLNAVGQLFYGLNKKSTMNNQMKSLVEQLWGRRGGVGKNLRQDLITSLDTPLAKLDEATAAAAREKVFTAFELYNNGDMDGALQIIKSFNPVERSYFDGVRDMNILRNNLNRSTMSLGKIQQYDNGMHMPRLYDQAAFAKEFDEAAIEAYASSQNKVLDLNPARRRKQLEDIAEEIRETMLRDPAQATIIRTEIALHNKAISEYAGMVGAIPDAVADASVRGYLPIPDSPRYGDLAGKWVRRDLAEPMLSGDARFKSEAYQHVNKLLDKYQTSIFGKLENGLRQILTIYNPATRLGNRAANITQGQMAGFNFPEMAVSQQHFMNVLRNGGDEWTRLAHAFGAIDGSEAFGRFSGAVQESNIPLLRRAQEGYRGADAGAKVAMFKWQVNRGASPEDAARFVNRALPNIGNSGEIYSFFSRLPVLGIPFRAIQPEVLRALASTATRNTVPFLVAMTAYTTLQNISWDGVDPEERKQIQERFGAGQTPFASINKFFGSKGIPTDKVLPSSWSVNVGGLFGKDPETGGKRVVDVDPRRLMGMYSINTGGESAADSLVDQALKASPVNIPASYTEGKWAFQPQNLVGSRLFSPLYQAAIDTDFRGKSINNPDRGDEVVDPETLRPLNETQPRDNLGRLAQFFMRSYVPQTGEVANIVDANAGRENFYGQDMNMAQAIARLFGLKGEQFTDKRLEKMRETGEYYNDLDLIKEQLKTMTPAEQESWKRLTGFYKLEEMVANDFDPGTERRKKAPIYDFGEDKWKDYAANPRLYELMIQNKLRAQERTKSDEHPDGQPIQPEFDQRLSEGFRKQLIQNKMVAPGDDAELDQRMYSSPEWDYYQALKDEYKEKSKAYYPEGDDEFVDELVKHQDAKFPDKPEILKQYGAQYAAYANGKAANKPEFTDQIKAAKEQFNLATFNWTNDERKARGLPPIVWEMWNNPTFGYDESPSGFGFGFGFGGGGGSSRSYQTDMLGRLFNYTGTVDRYDPIKPKELPNVAQLFARLRAGSGGGKRKPPIGAASRGQI